jgi:hypothetical protein
MAFTYDATGITPSGNDTISAVRWLLQDITQATVEVQDEEIQATYDAQDDTAAQAVRVYTTAVLLAQALERRYKKQASFATKGASVQYKERADAWSGVVADLTGQLTQLLEAATDQSFGIAQVTRNAWFPYQDFFNA